MNEQVEAAIGGARPTVKINSVEREVRRLNVKDVFTVGRIFGVAVHRGGREVQAALTAGALDPAELGLAIIAAMPYAEDDCIKLFASLCGMSADEFSEAPPEALIEVAEAVASSEDLKAFLDRVVKVSNLKGRLLAGLTDGD